jgi:hypothetical protein
MTRQLTKWRWLNMLLLLSVLISGLGAWTDISYAETIKDRIKATQGEGSELSQLEKKVDDSTNNVVKSARRIFVTLTIIFGLWLGITYFRAGFSPDTLRETKGRIVFFIVFLVFSFWTEALLGALYKFFGIDLSTL